MCSVAIVAVSDFAPPMEQRAGGVAQSLGLFNEVTGAVPRQTRVKGKAVEMRRVIVTLRLDGYNPTDEVAIAAVQDRIISAVTKLGATVERRYPNIPQLSLTVSPQALVELRRSPDVISVHEDVPHPPTR